MDIQTTLKGFKTELDPRIARYFDARIAEMKKQDKFIAESLEHVRAMTLAGGKRLRPAFMQYGYLAAGGTDRERLLDTAIAVELIHMFLLIHDDIIDRDALRHGVPTLHERYARWGRNSLGLEDPVHFGNSIALIVGDMLFAMGNDIIFQSGFPLERVFKALSQTQKIVSYTGIGEANDIYMEYRGKATRKEVLRMYEQKTARYTFEGPLHLGAILAGGNETLLTALSRYALPLGTAFQIQDDILGIFGTEERIGKPVGSDIQEGKITLLVALVYERGGTHGDAMRHILSQGRALRPADIERFKAILIDSGALADCRALANKCIVEAKAALETVNEIPAETEEFLNGVSEYMLQREY